MPKFIKMPIPVTLPLGAMVYPVYAQEVWDAFVKPDQDAEILQSNEMRMLMAILRSFVQGEVIEEDENVVQA